MREYNFDFIRLFKLRNHLILVSFILLEKYFFGCYNQQVKIEKNKLNIRSYQKRNNNDWQIELKNLFLNIHFYLICWANIMKILRKLENTIKDKNFKKIIAKYNPKLKKFIEFRTYLEHFIENLENEKKKRLLKNPADMGNLNGDFFTFGGKKLYIGEENLELLDNFYDDLNRWLGEINFVDGGLE